MNHIPAAPLAIYTAGDPALDDTSVWAIKVHLEELRRLPGAVTGVVLLPLTALLGDVQVMIDRAVRAGHEPVRRHAWRHFAHRWAARSLKPRLLTVCVAVSAAFLLDLMFLEMPSLVLLAPVALIAGMVVAW